MVTSAPGLLGRIRAGIRDGISGDWSRLGARMRALRGDIGAGPGLHAYRTVAGGRSVRLHLRIHRDRTGLLFINAVQQVHLSPTQAEMAKLALDGIARPEALGRLRTIYPDVPTANLAEELDRTAEMVRRASSGPVDCPTCDLGLPQPPPLSVRAQAPYKADLALHYRCNNRCSHCYNEPGRRQMRSLAGREWERVLDRLWQIGVPYVIFTGGEPTLHDDIVGLIAHASSLGMICGMNTNGRWLSRERHWGNVHSWFAGDLVMAGLDHVQITLASHRAEVHDRVVGCEGAFVETVAGIRRAVECGLHTLTNTTLTRDNAGEALQIVEFLCGLGVRTFAMNGMIHSGCGAGHPAALDAVQAAPILERVRDRAGELGMRFLWYTPTEHCRFSPVEAGLGIRCCNAAEYSICIEPSGDVLPCQSWYEPAGNLLADPWQSIWDSDLFRRIRYRRERPRQAGLPESCAGCERLRICGGGCLLERSETPAEVMRA